MAKDIYENEDSLVPMEMSTYYLGLLKRGEKWTAEETVETARTQAAHLAHIRQMFEDGHIVVAGPFTDGGQLRGVFLFKTGSLEEAEALAAADPAAISGRLVVEIHPWMVPAGILP